MPMNSGNDAMPVTNIRSDIGLPKDAAAAVCDPIISIVTACYNSVPFLDRLHQSLAAQTYQNFEWICVDDCSTDDTVERLRQLASPGALGMQVYRLPQNTGGPVALSVGTQHTRGEVVIWLDHDDELFPFALEEVRRNGPQVRSDAKLSGVSFRAVNPADGALVGRQLEPNRRFTASEAFNRYPDVSDGVLAIRGDLFRQWATVEMMENVVLNSVIYLPMTEGRPFVIADAPAVRYYHRDNPASQTRLERISRKTVASYARTIDAANRHFLRRPGMWARHIATMLRYSKQVHGRWFEALKHIKRGSIRTLVVALWPLGVVAYLRRRGSPNIVEIPYFDPKLAEHLPDLWTGPRTTRESR
jgi:glycosyltransferase involved in cell wall biosynthesis